MGKKNEPEEKERPKKPAKQEPAKAKKKVKKKVKKKGKKLTKPGNPEKTESSKGKVKKGKKNIDPNTVETTQSPESTGEKAGEPAGLTSQKHASSRTEESSVPETESIATAKPKKEEPLSKETAALVELRVAMVKEGLQPAESDWSSMKEKVRAAIERELREFNERIPRGYKLLIEELGILQKPTDPGDGDLRNAIKI